MINDNKGNPIRSLGEWQETFASGNKSKHWKKDRSAYALADFILNHKGIDHIRDRLQEILKYDLYFEKAIPELEVQFDQYGQGRVHDLGISGRTQRNQNLFIGLEAKVDEPFNQSVQDIYLNAKLRQLSGKSTKAPERVEELIQLLFVQPDRSVFDLRYQLLYATAGTLATGAEVSVLYLLIFKTKLYDELIGLENLREYLTFLRSLGAVELESSRTGSLVHQLEIKEKTLLAVYEELDCE